ncbi:MAG: MOSC domain-containing protein, partial [SAR324 cluster bacterium]|nr:MOSC domain-containing protein [SAR324 cluster bacterium]
SDGFPLLLISESSLSDLNNRLPESIAMKRFRPNMVVKNTEPYAEDNWKKIRIGECEFQIVKSCSRCILTTVDPETGKFSGKEPLRTLAGYRKQNGNVQFGQNLIATINGKLSVGMPVEIVTQS